MDGYHTCALGEMETCIRHHDETFEEDHPIFFPGHDIMMVLGGVSGEGASPQAMQES